LQTRRIGKKCERFELEITKLRQQNADYEKIINEKQKNNRSYDVKLNRALEDAEKYRKLLQKEKYETKNSTDVQNTELLKLREENKKLNRQKMELFAAFKKQLKLIDILKKNKKYILKQQKFYN